MEISPALAEAVAAQDVAEVTRLLRAGADPLSVDEDGTPVALLAADSGDVALVQAFLDAGLPVDGDRDYETGTSPLVAAVRGGHLPLTELLVSLGADPNVVERGDVETGTALTFAMDLEDPAPFVAVLLAAGADPGLARTDGWTPLMMAASFGLVSLVRSLLDAGAPVDASAFDGELNALGAARYRHRDDVEKLLLERGATEPVDPDVPHVARGVAEIDEWLAARPHGEPADEAAVDACAGRLAAIVADIAAWFTVHVPREAADLESYRGGTDPAEIAAAEAALGAHLPVEFRAYLTLFGGTDGLDIAEYDGLSLERALERWQGLEELRADGTFATWTPRETRPGNGFVQFTWWHPGWLPFAQDGAGNLYCVDLDPADRGTYGQVISWENHAGPTGPIVASIEAYLVRYLERLGAGEYEFEG